MPKAKSKPHHETLVPDTKTFVFCKNCDSQRVVRTAIEEWDPDWKEWVHLEATGEYFCISCGKRGLSTIFDEVRF